MNKFLGVVVVLCAGVFLLAMNSVLFEQLFNLDMSYLKNTGWMVLFSCFMTAAQISLFRVVTGKLKIKLVWE